MSTWDWVALAVLGWGTALVFGELRWFRRRALHLRLEPYVPASTAGAGRPATEDVHGGGFGELAAAVGDRLARAAGVRERLDRRLRRAGAEIDPVAFRTRQFTAALVALLVSTGAVLAVRPSAWVGLVALAGAPLLTALAFEHLLDRRIARRQRQLLAALPVTAEQLGLLIGAGHSLGSALGRLSRRTSGAVAADLTEVVRRIRQGHPETDALAEWADLSGLAPVERLVGVLSLHRDAADLSALISLETAAMRADAHRRLLTTIERRGQLVWVPVTVATLVPGLVLLAVPFVEAMARVTGT